MTPIDWRWWVLVAMYVASCIAFALWPPRTPDEGCAAWREERVDTCTCIQAGQIARPVHEQRTRLVCVAESDGGAGR